MTESLNKLVLVGERCIKNKDIRTAANVFTTQYELCFSDTGIEYAGCSDEEYDIVMVYDDFCDQTFTKLNSRNCYIVGPQIFISASLSEPALLPRRRRPIYNNAMKDAVICFTGFSDRNQISELASLVHFMNGTIRKEYSPNVTHVVANHCRGEKYKKAVSFGRPIMQSDWIHQVWDKRENQAITANSPEMMQYKAPPFLRCGIAFHGFSEDDLKEMEEMAMNNGGQLSHIADPDCTHLVVDNIQTLPNDIKPGISIVKAEWFWASVQMEVCADERVYVLELEGRENTPNKRSTPSKSRYSLSRSKKRKRYLRENLAALASEGQVTPGSANTNVCKSRRSSADQLSVSFMSGDITPDSSGCLLDTPTPPASLRKPRLPRTSYLRALDRDSPSPSQTKKSAKSPSPEKNQAKPSAKKLVVAELLQTEVNYCGILSNILSVFRDGAEKADQPGGPILSSTDSKIIFGKIPPILEVHKEIRQDLEQLLQNWTDDALVADIILSKVEKLRQTYPPFVNYMEKTKEKIAECMKSNHRFHAFMKVCERRPECGKQPLADLMMSIVQRLPRIELLLQQIHKYTDKKSSDYRSLELAQSDLKDVNTHINEDKRITDGRMALFDIMNDIDNCPANLLSASRNLVLRVDVDEVSDELVGRGERLTLILFTDSLEIVKRRHKTQHTPFKSPAAANRATQAASSHKSKPFKHIEFLTLQSIKRVLDITLADEESQASIFSLVCRKVTDSREKLYTFQITDMENVDKLELLNVIARNIANCACRPDYDTFITSRPAEDFLITPLEGSSNNKTMTRAVSKFGKRLSRAMTMRGVPSPLKRAVSTMITPTRRASMRRADASSISSTNSMWELDAAANTDGSPQLINTDSPVFMSYSTLPRHVSSMTSSSSHQPGSATTSNTFRVSTMLTKHS